MQGVRFVKLDYLRASQSLDRAAALHLGRGRPTRDRPDAAPGGLAASNLPGRARQHSEDRAANE